MNILLLSVGTRNKVVQYFKKSNEGRGKIAATDMHAASPALYEADIHFVVPNIMAPGYINAILDICKKENIDGVLSLIDPELSLLAKNSEKFKAVGTTVIGSAYDLCEMSLDKMRMYEFCVNNGYHTARSYSSLKDFKTEFEAGKIGFPVFVKPRQGSASLAVSKVSDMETVEMLFAHAKKNEQLMIQEFLDGQEIGADVYIDLISGQTVSIFTKKKLLMRAGETDKAVSFKDPRLFALIEEFVKKAGYRGQIDIDIFDINGQYYISEVNPRFGGGYPHAYECGCDHMKLILNNLAGIVNEKNIGAYEDGMYMMKYNEVAIRTRESLF